MTNQTSDSSPAAAEPPQYLGEKTLSDATAKTLSEAPKKQDQCKDMVTEQNAKIYLKSDHPSQNTHSAMLTTKAVHVSYHRSDAKAFYEHWKQFK
eukprot:5823423-Pyramimonas_sp.AAC.1